MRPRVVLITGASSGIGRVCAAHLHARGYRVYGTSRKACVAAQPPGVPPMIPLDVTSDESVHGAVATIVEREGRLDAVVNNAGYGIAGAVEETTTEAAREQFETNFFGTMRVCRAALPIMRQQGGGRIVNVSSIAGQVAIPFQALYSASKFAVEGFTEALRMEAAPFGIRVSLIEPGDFRTRFSGNRQLTFSGETDAYRELARRAIGVMERDETHGPTPEAVARLVEHILTRRSPRLRYTVGPISERLAIGLKRFVPARLFEWGIATYYGVR